MEKDARKYANRLAFSQFVASKKSGKVWMCCDEIWKSSKDIHRHCARQHKVKLDEEAVRILSDGCSSSRWKLLRPKQENSNDDSSSEISESQTLPWLPEPKTTNELSSTGDGQILLFYKYRWIDEVQALYCWQKCLCERLKLTGKVRIATEGINGTVGGSTSATEMYINAMLCHPLFADMSRQEFKSSVGSSDDFSCGLKIGVYDEIVPLGIDPTRCSFQQAGGHLSPEEFHRKMGEYLKFKGSDTVVVDCRNYYENKIGMFSGAVTPDIRKFSYWPEYVDNNISIFRDKDVLMYCTGGIRCERGSAYLKSKGICKDIYQLEGGIHKYIEKYPDGFYRGKLFVFDDRFTLQSNDDVISKCFYCSLPWDTYKSCSSEHCHLLVLSCDSCRSVGRTSCCETCDENSKTGVKIEQCRCTQQRDRVTMETTVNQRRREDEPIKEHHDS